jgi:sensor domain CHASE-containing protein
MSLQAKVISLILFVVMAYGALDFGVQHLFILPSFHSLEREEAEKNMERVIQAIERDIKYLAASTVDWSTWDDTYKFVQDQNDAFRESNLNDMAMESLKVNLLLIFNAAHQTLWGKMYDIEKHEEIALPAVFEQLAAKRPLTALTHPDAKAEGIMLTEQGPILVAARPVLTSEREGPVLGRLMLGRILDVSSIAEQTRTHMKITVLNGSAIPPEKAAIVTELRSVGRTMIRKDETVSRVYRLLGDIFGKQALLVQVDVPNTISAQGERAIQFALLSLFVAGIIILTVLVIGLRWMVLTPLKQLTRHTVAIGQSNVLSEHIHINRRDELGKLAEEFNRMVARLEEAREALAAQSYNSGIAEMASGVLHNIGNAITPLSVKLSTLKADLKKAPVEEMDLAAAELADPATPPDRRADLSQFVELAGMELATLVRYATGEMEKIRNQVDHVQLILSDQQRFSRAQRVIHSLDLSRLVAESIDLLPDSVRKSVVFEQDPSLEKIGRVKAAKIALQQVISNLLLNAAESIRGSEQRRNSGRIHIHGTEERAEDNLMAHLVIADNGAGISPQNLPKIFERGFSTKPRGSGLGLHWSANTIAALKGRLYAESEGERRGAVFHLLLPLSRINTETQESSS